MLKDREGHLKVYSLAIVLEDKPRDSDTVVCHPIEELPLVDGDVNEWKLEYDVTLPDVNGVKKTSAVKLDSKIKARWLAYGHSNRVTSPDLIKNETILLFRYADTDEYWWTTIFHEPKIRRLETVRHEYGNLQAPLEEWEKALKNCYSYEVSTHDKHVWLQTVTSDGEPFSYDIKLNTKEAILTIVDSNDNMIKLWSPDRRIGIKTSVVDIDTDTVNIRNDVNIYGNLKVQGNIGSPSVLQVPSCNPGCAATSGEVPPPGNSFPLTAVID